MSRRNREAARADIDKEYGGFEGDPTRVDTPDEARTAVEGEMLDKDVEGTRAALEVKKEVEARQGADRDEAEEIKVGAIEIAEDAESDEPGDVDAEIPDDRREEILAAREPRGRIGRLIRGSTNAILATGWNAGRLGRVLLWPVKKLAALGFKGFKSLDDEGLKIIERTDVLKPEEEKDKDKKKAA